MNSGIRKNVFIFLSFFLSFSLCAQEKAHRPTVGLVLSGGGAKGYAHVGVLEELEKMGIPIDYIGGTSMGAIVGGLYASGYSAKELNKIVHEVDFEEIIYNDSDRNVTPFYQKMHNDKYLISLEFDHFKLSFPKAISKGQGVINTLTKYFQRTQTFDQLAIPFLCVATDIETGKQKVFSSGYLPQIVFASGAYPTLFNPVNIDSHYYTDGGVANNFPVKEVRDAGVDIIIGVDLSEGLQKEENLKNAASILEQIISFGIEEKSESQRKLTDVLITPNIKGFSVIDFEKKDTLIELGRHAATQVKGKLDSILELTGKKEYKPTQQLSDKNYLIEKIEIHGLKNYGKNYILGKLGIKTPQLVNYDMILKGVNALYATGNFKLISNKMVEKDQQTTLLLNLAENESTLYAKAGLHYDELFKSSLLLNLTAKNIISINSSLSLDLVLGDNLRYNINYFVDNGVFPSFGLNSSFMQFYTDYPINDDSGNNANYHMKNFKNQLYIQSTFKEKLATGLGIQHDFLQIDTNNLSDGNPFKTLQDNHFYTPYFFVKADNRNRGFYPTQGIALEGSYHYIMASSKDDFSPTSYIKSHVEINFPIHKRISLRLGSRFNTFFNDDIPIGLSMSIGGNNQQEILNTSPFYGLDFSETIGGSLFELSADAQIKTFKNQYFTMGVNLANIESSLSTLNFIKLKHQGYGASYGYMSPFGPIQGSLSYSPSNGKIIPYVSLGYWF